MDLVIGYVGMAYAGKDTTNAFVIDSLLPEKTKEVDTPSYATVYKNNTQPNMVCFHTPLALEVKKEYLQECKDSTLTLDQLLYDPFVKARHREGLIGVGDGRRENVDKFYWLKKIEETIKYLQHKYSHVKNRIFTITDMRYENELPYMENYCSLNNICILSVKLKTELASIAERMDPKHAKDYLCMYKNNNSERNVKRVHADIEINNSGPIYTLKSNVQTKIIPVIEKMLS